MELKSDNFYIDSVLNGDTNAFNSLVMRYQDFVFHIAFKIVNNEMDAEEVAQDAFIKDYKALGNFSKKSKFSTWLYKIAYHTAISKTRSNQYRYNQMSIEDEHKDLIQNNGTELLAGLIESEQSKYINLAFESLPESTQLVMNLFYIKEYSIKEIVEITGITKSNIKTHLFRGRKKMLEKLEQLLKKELRSII